MDLEKKIATASTILETRKARAKKMEAFTTEREAYHDERLKELRAAHTPNGQLIAAILEEENWKTIDELNSWCDELATMDRTELKELLQGFTLDGVIEKKGDKYGLVRLCEDNLMFSNEDCFKEWVITKCRNYQINQNKSLELLWVAPDGRRYQTYGYLAKIIYTETLSSLLKKRTHFVFYPEDLLGGITSHNEWAKEYNDKYFNFEEGAFIMQEIKLTGLNSFEKMLAEMVEAKVLKTNETGIYWVPLLGEK